MNLRGGAIVLILITLPGILGEVCPLSQWSGWSSCNREVQCENIEGTKEHADSVKQLRIRSIKPSGRSRVSRNRMAEAMNKKRALAKEVGHCQETFCQYNGLWGSEGRIACDNVTGLAGNKPCHNIDQVAFIPIKFLMGGHFASRDKSVTAATNDLWGWTDSTTGDEWVILGMAHGTSFIKITDSTNPKPLAFIPTRTKPSPWRDIKVVDDVAYIVSEAQDHGLQYFDLTRLRKLDNFKVLQPDGYMKHFGPAHNLVANEDRMLIHVVGGRVSGKTCDGGLHMIDVSVRLKPKFVGCYKEDSYVHDAQCLIYQGEDVRFKGKNICFCYNEDTLTIVDVDDPKTPRALSITAYSGSKYTHQGWLTKSHNTLLMDDELDEAHEDDKRTKTFVWDVRDLIRPRLKSTYYSPRTVIDHNQYVKDDYTYQSNYADGLIILHIDEAKYKLTEVAHFDVDPANFKAEFKGTWSNYPYFKSGIIPVSSIYTGLFLLEPRWEGIQNDISSPRSVQKLTTSGVSRRFRAYKHTSQLVEKHCNASTLVETEYCQTQGCTWL